MSGFYQNCPCQIITQETFTSCVVIEMRLTQSYVTHAIEILLVNYVGTCVPNF